MKLLLGNFNAKAGREDIFKPTTWDQSLYDNGVRVVNFATSKNITVKSAIFPHRNIRKFTYIRTLFNIIFMSFQFLMLYIKH
jgi:hypothetical protein